MMKKKEKYYSEACEAIHEGARDLHELGAITGERMQEYDAMCFVQEDETAPGTPQSKPITPAFAHTK
jgi:DNA-binding transcriptional regulator YiaG